MLEEAVMEYGSAREYFERMREELDADQIRELRGTYEFDIKDAGKFIVRFNEDGTLEVFDEGSGVEPDCTLMAKEKDWLSIVSGRTKPMSAFMTNKLKVKGSLGKAMKLQKVLDGSR
ncbi:Sterol-binding protein [Rubrobacter xylanophilus DSM 9941]|uniref:Sterol-binding protein n=2 Tax=Rubrobacter xylanophilus TaxID=49319 RepID=Q1AT92_RUBXD|nr:Sterol-binding protein [Rubrobacter xylanophilus DSM 9941]